MRGAAFLILTTGLAAGCHTTKHDVSVPLVEEYRTAPNDPTYNSPPEQGYTKPAPKKEFKPGVSGSAPGMGGGGMGVGLTSSRREPPITPVMRHASHHLRRPPRRFRRKSAPRRTIPSVS